MITYLTEDHVTESGNIFVTEASSLGHRPGEAMPLSFSTDLGSCAPFRFSHMIEGAWIFKQAVSGRELHILND